MIVSQGSGGAGSSASFSGFGSMTGFGTPDTSTVDGLMQLAQMRGGSVAAAADELVHPDKSILSTMSDGFKHAFSDFVDIVSTPSEVVAGLLSSDLSVSDAVKNRVKVSDVIWGDQDPNASTLSKVGSFSLRLATDVLTDPLTYLTFGAGEGLMGLRALPKVTLGAEAAAKMGAEELASKALSQEGFNVFSYLKKVTAQQAGAEIAPELTGVAANADSAYNLAKGELDHLMKNTIDAPLSMDYAKKAMSNLLEKYPQLTDTLLDKGGMKYFGQTIISGQRIDSALKMIPGFKLIDQITAPIRKPIQALFDPAMIKVDGVYKRLPEEFMNAQTTYRDLAKNLGDDRLHELNNIVKANGLTAPESQFLMASVESGRIPADARLANAYKQLLGFNNDEFTYLKRMGVNISRLDNHAPHILNDLKVESVGNILPPKVTAGAGMKRTIEGSIFKGDEASLGTFEKAVLSKDQKVIGDTVAQMKNSGMEIFDDNLVSAHIQRTTDNVKTLTSKQFVEDVAATFGQKESLAPKGWRAIDNSKISKLANDTFGVLSDGEHVLFHPAIADKIEKFMGAVINDAPTQDMLRNFDRLQNFWKGSVTSIFPSFHGRNAISNVFLNFMDLGVHALNPVIHTQATQLLMMNRQYESLLAKSFVEGEAGNVAKDTLHDLLTKEMFTDSHGYKWTFGELRQEIANRNVAFGRNLMGSMDFEESRSALVAFKKEGKDRAKSIIKDQFGNKNAAFQFGRDVGGAIEQQARLVNFVANLKNTGDVSLAAQRTKQFLFDYQSLTPFEKNFMRRVIPFYTFTRKNLELQAKSLLTTPGRVAAEMHLIGTLGDVMSGGQLNAQEEAALPDWVKSGVNILASKKGSTVEVIAGLGSPLEQPFQAIQPNQILGSISPLIRVPLEQMTGYSFFQGKMLSDVTNAAAFKDAPQIVKDFIGYTSINGKKSDGTPFTWYVALRPERMNLVLNLPPTTRVLSALKQMQSVDVSGQNKILQQVVGVRPYSFDLEQEAAKREKETRAQLEDLLNKAGVVATYKRTFVPKTGFGQFK